MTDPAVVARRSPGVTLRTQGESVEVEVGGLVVAVSPVAAAIVETIPEGGSRTSAEIAEAVVAAFGEPAPPDTASRLTDLHLHDLAAHGIITLDGHGRLTTGAASPAGVTALTGALRHILEGRSRPWHPPDQLTTGELLNAARQHHVVPFIAQHGDALALDPREAAGLRAESARRASAADLLAGRLDKALGALTAAGVRCLTVKGLALAAQAYGDHSLRGAGDLDLLVAPAELEAAHAALVGAGAIASSASPRPGPTWAWRHFRATNHEVSLTLDGSAIDLHWWLVPTRGTFPDFETLWSRRESVQVGGHQVSTLGAYDALTHAAGHAAKDGWCWLRNLVDIHLLAGAAETWHAADRPLRPDQFLSLGLAARLLGTPQGAPPVMHEALAGVDDQAWQTMLHHQATTSMSHQAPRVPGLGLISAVRVTTRTSDAPSEVRRLLSRTVFPPWLTADEHSPHAWVAVPRVLQRRAKEVGQRIRRRRTARR